MASRTQNSYHRTLGSELLLSPPHVIYNFKSWDLETLVLDTRSNILVLLVDDLFLKLPQLFSLHFGKEAAFLNLFESEKGFSTVPAQAVLLARHRLQVISLCWPRFVYPQKRGLEIISTVLSSSDILWNWTQSLVSLSIRVKWKTLGPWRNKKPTIFRFIWVSWLWDGTFPFSFFSLLFLFFSFFLPFLFSFLLTMGFNLFITRLLCVPWTKRLDHN